MDKLLKGEEYFLTNNDRTKISAGDLAHVFRRAAVKEGFGLRPISAMGGEGNYASFRVEENVPFSKIKQILALVSQLTGTEIYISGSEDLLGKKMQYAAEPSKAIRQNAFLMGAPSGYAGKP